MSSKHQSKKYKPLNLKNCRPKKDRMELLFEKIKQQEAERRGASVIAEVKPQEEPAQQKPGELDKRIQQELEKPVRQFRVIDAGKEESMSRKLKELAFAEEQEHEEWYIKNNATLAPMLDYQTVIQLFTDLVENVGKQHVCCNNKLSDTDRKIQDLLHEIRMPKRNAYEGFKLYQMLHYLEIERQAYKDGLAILTPLANFANANRDLLQKLQNICQRLADQKELKESRIYMPRSNLDLPIGDAFRALPKEEQERIRQNYESRRHAS